MKIPIFIITRDRVSVLKRCLPGYLALEDVEIVIHDNGSTYTPMVNYLKELEKDGITVYRYPNTLQTFESISELVRGTIEDWYKTHNAPYYIVTDPDIELENPSKDLLRYYISVLDKLPEMICVGPMLRIDDLPECFHFRDQMIKSHMEQFWDEKKHPRVEFHGVNIQVGGIDTTFAVYRKDFKFSRLNVGIRVHEPYMARHLDWYLDTKNLSEEQKYYKEHASDVSTMSMHIRKGGMY